MAGNEKVASIRARTAVVSSVNCLFDRILWHSRRSFSAIFQSQGIADIRRRHIFSITLRHFWVALANQNSKSQTFLDFSDPGREVS